MKDQSQYLTCNRQHHHCHKNWQIPGQPGYDIYISYNFILFSCDTISLVGIVTIENCLQLRVIALFLLFLQAALSGQNNLLVWTAHNPMWCQRTKIMNTAVTQKPNYHKIIYLVYLQALFLLLPHWQLFTDWTNTDQEVGNSCCLLQLFKGEDSPHSWDLKALI